jgi:NAD(P)H-dependent flavin oxidoreductase YrpB (nitropropane dioxygenase family)
MALDALIAAVESGSGGPSWVALVIAVAAAVGGVGGVVALLNLPKMRRKMDADTADVLTKAALALVEPLRRQVEVLGSRVQTMEAEQLAQHRLHTAHKAWDELAFAVASEAGMVLPPPPPLQHVAA